MTFNRQRKQRPLKDQTGRRFGRLVVCGTVELDNPPGSNHLMSVNCDCGALVVARMTAMRSGNTRSCGCLQREVTAARNEVHGLSRAHPREYRSWKDMRARCNNPNNADYPNYGGRGIAVCSRWADFALFFADMGPRPEGKTLDRINSNGGYSPDNCRWLDSEGQANNQRRVPLFTIDGESLSIAQWCRRYGVLRSTVAYRVKRGMALKEALTSGDLRASHCRVS